MPPAPDVHTGVPATDICLVREAVFAPSVDLVRVALAHDEQHLFALFSTQSAMPLSSPSVAFSATVLLDVDNNATTGLCSSALGAYPNQCGTDVAVEFVWKNGTLLAARVSLYALTSAQDYGVLVALLKTGQVRFLANAVATPAPSWIYWSPDAAPSASDAAACAASGPGAGPFALPSGASICLGALPGLAGAAQWALSADGLALEVAFPLDGLLADAQTGRAALALGATTTLQVAVRGMGAADATAGRAYFWGSPPIPLVGIVLVPICCFLTGAVLAALAVCFCRKPGQNKAYTAVQ